MTRTIGVIGIGAMGEGIATTLAASYPVVVYDVDAQKREQIIQENISAVDSSQAVGREADIVLLSLPSNEAVETATVGEQGVLQGLSPGDVLIDTSTISPETSQQVADASADREIGFLDAPVSGGARNAQTGELSVMVGGQEAILREVREVLETIGANVVHVGQQGTGVAMKLINNYLFAVNQAALCEGVAMAREAGISDEQFTEVVRHASGGSYALERNMERFIIPNQFETEGSMSILTKDVRLAEQFADSLAVPLLVGGGVSNIYQFAKQLGLAHKDVASLIKLYELRDAIAVDES